MLCLQCSRLHGEFVKVLKQPLREARARRGQKQKEDTDSETRAEFIEEAGLAFEAADHPRMAGRIFGLLLIADRPMLSSAEIAKELKASKASVSTMTRALLQAGAIERVSRSGDRKDYFRITSESFDGLIEEKVKVVNSFLKLLEKGRPLTSPNNRWGRDCLESMLEFYQWFSSEMPALIERWRRRKKSGKSP